VRAWWSTCEGWLPDCTGAAGVTTMKVRLNGTDTDLPAGSTIATVVRTLAPAARRIAVERNGGIVPRSQWPTCLIEDGDRLEVVGAVGGG